MNTIPSTPIASSSRFRGEMMRQIYRVWLFRKFFPVLIGEILIISLLVYALGRAVFVQRIFENALHVFFQNPSAIVSFFISAFSHAPLFTKGITVGLILLVALLIRHLTQGLLRWILVRGNYFAKLKQ